MDEAAKTEMLTALLISGNSSGSKEPTIEPRPNGNSGKPVTTESYIDPNLKAKIEASLCNLAESDCQRSQYVLNALNFSFKYPQQPQLPAFSRIGSFSIV
jgi:hypothetical protein